METYSMNGITYEYPTHYLERIAALIAALASPRGAESRGNGGPVQPYPPRPYAGARVPQRESAPGDQPGAPTQDVRRVA